MTPAWLPSSGRAPPFRKLQNRYYLCCYRQYENYPDNHHPSPWLLRGCGSAGKLRPSGQSPTGCCKEALYRKRISWVAPFGNAALQENRGRGRSCRTRMDSRCNHMDAGRSQPGRFLDPPHESWYLNGFTESSLTGHHRTDEGD